MGCGVVGVWGGDVRELLGYVCLAVFALLAGALSRFRARAAWRGDIGALRMVPRLSALPALVLMAFATSASPAIHAFPFVLLLAGIGAFASLAHLR